MRSKKLWQRGRLCRPDRFRGSSAEAADVERASRDAIQAAGPEGFILGSGCEVPPAAPQENIAAMIRTAREWKT